MQVNMLSVQHVFEREVVYRVPLYQRPYVWNEEEQWQPLWDDIVGVAHRLLIGAPARAHFIGATVQDHEKVPPGTIETRLLIDGQQRLTTLQLLLKAFADITTARGNPAYAAALGKLVRNDHPLNTHAFQRFKVWPTNADRADFERVMAADGRATLAKACGGKADTKRVGRTIADGYLFFYDAIEHWLGESEAEADARIGALYAAIRENVRLVVIDLDERDDAQLIFETLNARGTPLLAADLVKNALLSAIERQTPGKSEAAYLAHWQMFDNDTLFWREMIGRGHAQRAPGDLRPACADDPDGARDQRGSALFRVPRIRRAAERARTAAADGDAQPMGRDLPSPRRTSGAAADRLVYGASRGDGV